MDGELIFVGSRSTWQPGRCANWEELVVACRQVREGGNIVCGRGRQIDAKKCNCAVGVNLGSEGEWENTGGGRENLAAISGKVAAMVSRLGWGVCNCLGA